ncbi:hypothetical protein [Kitasatospora sp. MBT63]|uniref:hypothetical protein n=1 Tax=Kitasatospora sp. MBT63 TaxID=1444768 RepID=UPI00053AF37C|nr:hypothetical protein [Kitasatospora sp. MBT63]
MKPENVMLAGDVLTWATTKTTQVKTLILAVAVVLVIAAVISAYWRTKSWVATLVAFVLGALVLWGINNMDSLKGKVGSEIDEKPAASAPHVRVVQALPGPSAHEIGRL